MKQEIKTRNILNKTGLGFNPEFHKIQDNTQDIYRNITKPIPDKTNSLLVQFGSRYYNIRHEKIAYIYNKESINILVTKTGERFPVNISLEKMLTDLDRRKFNRMSKNLIVSIDSIKSIYKNENQKMMIVVEPDIGLEFVYNGPQF